MASKDSTTVDHWHTLLRDVAQLKPTDLLIGATSWDDIEFSGRSVANGTIEDRRRFYWTTRMFSLESAQFFKNATRTFEEVLGEGGPAVRVDHTSPATTAASRIMPTRQTRTRPRPRTIGSISPALAAPLLYGKYASATSNHSWIINQAPEYM
jgi:hypothetical protein